MISDISYISGIASNLRTPRVASEDLVAFVSYSSRIRAVSNSCILESRGWKHDPTVKIKKKHELQLSLQHKLKNKTNTLKEPGMC